MKYLLIYLLIINVVSFIMMFIDKQKAIRNQWRISEKTLFMVAIMGGSVGSLLGMTYFRHKTKHVKFVVGFWLIAIIQISAFIYIRSLVD